MDGASWRSVLFCLNELLESIVWRLVFPLVGLSVLYSPAFFREVGLSGVRSGVEVLLG
jgi:hypothetical protein